LPGNSKTLLQGKHCFLLRLSIFTYFGMSISTHFSEIS
jgi:hypothetical protein